MSDSEKACSRGKIRHRPGNQTPEEKPIDVRVNTTLKIATAYLDNLQPAYVL
jgi:hypothetical protein